MWWEGLPKEWNWLILENYNKQYTNHRQYTKNKEKDKRKIRDKALLLIGFSGGFRRSELVNIEYDDIDFVLEGVKIFVKKSKTDQSGEGMTKAIPYFDNEKFCPVIALKNWIDLFDLKKNYFKLLSNFFIFAPKTSFQF